MSRRCAKCDTVQPLVVCFECIDKVNTTMTGFNTLLRLAPPPSVHQYLQPMKDGFMPLDIVCMIVAMATAMPLEPHETAVDRYRRMSGVCKRTRRMLPPLLKAPPLTEDERAQFRSIFTNKKRSTRDRVVERRVDRCTKILGLISHRAYTSFVGDWINLDRRNLLRTWLYRTLQWSMSCHRIKCHTPETGPH